MTITVSSTSAITTRAVIGKPTLKIDGTTAYCVGKYRSGNPEDQISITLTLKQGNDILKSWKFSGKGSALISKTYTVTAKGTYTLTLSAMVNGQAKSSVTVTATSR